MNTQSNPKLAELHQIVKIEVTDLARGGKGVGRLESGAVIFIPKTAPGDIVRAKITRVEKRYAEGSLIEILTPSLSRIAPKCHYFDRCGGCDWQHLPYELQWKTKMKGLQQALNRLENSLETTEKKVLWHKVPFNEFPAEKIWNYRNRIQLRGFGNEVGYYESGTQNRVPITICQIADPEINSALPEIRSEGSKLSSRSGKEYKVEISAHPLKMAWNARHAATGFRQIHADQNDKLRTWVRDQLSPAGKSDLYDLYGGQGNLSELLKSYYQTVHVIDAFTASGPSQSVGSWSKDQIKKSKKTQLLGQSDAILDPPRAGLGDDFATIEQALKVAGVNRIVLIGCDVDSWVRDLRRFREMNWEIVKFAAFDFFPHTHHLECGAFLKLCLNADQITF